MNDPRGDLFCLIMVGVIFIVVSMSVAVLAALFV